MATTALQDKPPTRPDTGSEAVEITHRQIETAHARTEYTLMWRQRSASRLGVVVVPGYFGLHSSYMAYGEALTHFYDKVAVLKSARTQGLWDMAWRNVRHPELLEAKMAWTVIKDMLIRDGVEAVDIAGHSKGGPAAVNSADYVVQNKDSSAIRRVKLNMPAGSTSDNLPTLGRRAVEMFNHEVVPNLGRLREQVGAEVGTEWLEYALHPRTITEAVAVGRADLRPQLARLAQQGVPVDATFGVADRLFPPESAEKRIGSLVTNFWVLDEPADAGHIAPQLYPFQTAQVQAAA